MLFGIFSHLRRENGTRVDIRAKIVCDDCFVPMDHVHESVMIVSTIHFQRFDRLDSKERAVAIYRCSPEYLGPCWFLRNFDFRDEHL